MSIIIEHHHYFHDDNHTKTSLNSIINKLNKMPTKEEFDAAFAEIGSSLTNISDDITKLTDQLETGDLTPEQETEVFTKLRSIADQAKALADRTADAPPPEGGETPA